MRWILPIIIGFFCGCVQPIDHDNEQASVSKSTSAKLFTAYSNQENAYQNFDGPKAINKLAAIENEHFNALEKGYSRYYGTEWRTIAENLLLENGQNRFEEYQTGLGHPPDSLHCTLYAYEGLKAGLDSTQLTKLERLHHKIWKNREIAGWSLGYLLVKHFDWNAYLVINPKSVEYKKCLKAYQQRKVYPVWRQPEIPLEALYVQGKDDSLVTSLLQKHQFGWGFSEQGIHTWVTRFEVLKECNWLGVPSKKYTESYDKPLFVATKFDQFADYHSHVIVFPPLLGR